MKKIKLPIFIAFLVISYWAEAQMVNVNRWVSPVIGDFVTIPENKGTDTQITSWGYTNKIFQYQAYLLRPAGNNTTAVNRWEMPYCRDYILIAEHELTDAQLISWGYKNKELLFYAYRTRPASGNFIAVSRWVNANPQGNNCKDFTLSVTETELTDAQLTNWGYSSKMVQFYVPQPNAINGTVLTNTRIGQLLQAATIQTGDYNLTNKNSNLCLAIRNATRNNGEEGTQWTCDGNADKNWKVIDAGGGYYKLQNRNSNLFLAVGSASRDNGGRIVQYADQGQQDILWRFIDAGSGFYKIQNKNSSLFLAIGAGERTGGANLVQWADTGQEDIKWRLGKLLDFNPSGVGIQILRKATVFSNPNFGGREVGISSTGNKTVGELGITTVGSIKVAWGYKAILKIGSDVTVRPNPVTGVGGGTFAATNIEIVGDREGDILTGITAIEIVPYTPLSGWVDMHTHPMSYLGFGKKLMHGQPDGNPAIALANCNCTHGGWGTGNTCGNYVRAAVISNAFDGDFVHKNPNHDPFSGGNLHGDHQHQGIESSPSLLYWPHQSSRAHQQMWFEWIERAYREGGLRVMVALTVNSELLANVIDGDGPYDDKTVADAQIDSLIAFVRRHPFMQIARSSADLRRIANENKLAVIIGMEVDNIGNFHKNGIICDEASVKAEINRLYRKGVRYVFPIHLVDNKFGGAAVYEDLFNYANKYVTGSLFSVVPSSTIDRTITHRLGNGLDGEGNLKVKKALDIVGSIKGFLPAFDAISCPLANVSCWDKYKLIRNLVSPDPLYARYASIEGGHANEKGLSRLGVIAITELMKLGMLIDIDHMSQSSVDNTLYFARSFNYPVNIGHNGVRVNEGKERTASVNTVRVVTELGGLFGIGTSDSEEAHSDAESFIANFNRISPFMNYRGIAIGSDVNGMERLPRASSGLNSTSFYTNFSKCTMGNRTWDYTTEGVAHYGLMADYIRDIKNRNSAVYNNLMKSTEYFAQMWEKCERRGAYVR